MFAVFASGGKQHRVTEGEIIKLELITADPGQEVVFDKVLIVANGDQVSVGTILEKALGPEHPNVAQVLASYAELLRETKREDEAEKMEARAQAIRAKHAPENPKK